MAIITILNLSVRGPSLNVHVDIRFCHARRTHQEGKTLTNLFCNSRILQCMERLIKHCCTLVDVDNHGSFAFSTEETLEDPSELTLSERNYLSGISAK